MCNPLANGQHNHPEGRVSPPLGMPIKLFSTFFFTPFDMDSLGACALLAPKEAIKKNRKPFVDFLYGLFGFLIVFG